jgi:hypothetical protein
MWGKGVNTGTAINKEICTNAGPPSDVCGKGEEGTSPGQFGALSVIGSYITVDGAGTPTVTDDKVYVGDENRIQQFNADGEYQAEISIPGERVRGLAVDSAGYVYAAFCGDGGCGSGQAAKANVRKWSPLGIEQPEAKVIVNNPQGLATGPENELFVLDGATVRKFNSSGAPVAEETISPPFFPTYPFSPALSASTGIATGSACLSPPGYDLYVDNAAEAPNGFLRAYGPPPDTAHFALCPPPLHPPEIEDQGAVSVETDRAAVQATINPRFWKDTSYFVQFGTSACVEDEPLHWEAGCVKQKPLTPSQLEAGVTNVGAKTAKVVLTGLSPATTYQYRFSAQSRFDRNGVEVNENGGPVFGVGGTEALEGEASSFTTTTSPPPPNSNCPNKAFRSGAGAFLPDCRAYEMVSPVDKNGGDIRPNKKEGYAQASPDGNRIAYAALAAFGNPPSNKLSNQYLATRNGGQGWNTRGINAPQGKLLKSEPIGRQIGAFSADLCSEWFADYNATPLAPGGQEGFANLYRQDLCGGGGFEALTRTTVELPKEIFYVGPESIQGFSEDLSHVFVVAEAALETEGIAAAPKSNAQIYDYDRSGGPPRLVSVLPDGSADPGVVSAGAEVGGGASEGTVGGTLERAVSADGSRVFWTHAVSTGANGTLYLRENPEREQSALNGEECTEPEMACTLKVSTGSKAIFWSATPSGSEALYTEGPFVNSGVGQATLFSFDAEAQTRTPIAAGVRGVLGASEDLSRIYFVSTEDLTSGQQNKFEDEAQAGKPNLYLDEEGEITFIGTLRDGKDGDVNGGNVYGVGAVNPRRDATRVSPDGAHIAFQSRARLTHFDNTDANNGKADVEVFTYEAGEDLLCVSCNPSGVRPNGRELPEALKYIQQSIPTDIWAAAWIPAQDHPLHAPNVLSENGKRLFFLSNTSLVARDNNGAQDVYEWEAPGEGSCSGESADFRELNGGCVYLISSGESLFESELADASTDGHDVFFPTESSLVPQDPGLIDLYDARVGGGIVQPTQPAACEGETCQTPPAPPNYPTPASSSYKGQSNPRKEKPAPCHKGKVRRKGRCVAKKNKHAKRGRTASHNGRAAR